MVVKLTRHAGRLLYNQIHDFKSTAVMVESEIKRLGLQPFSKAPVPSMRNRTHTETWTSMKSVSHFNLGTALELMLKLILLIAGKEFRKVHTLHSLYCDLPEEWQKRLMGEDRKVTEQYPASPNCAQTFRYADQA